jgi:hypothetical protein
MLFNTRIRGRALNTFNPVERDEFGNKVRRPGVGRVAYVPSGRKRENAAVAFAKACGLDVAVVQTHVSEGWTAVDVWGEVDALARFLDSDHVLDYHQAMSVRPPRPVGEPGRTDNRRPAFESTPVRPAPRPPANVLSKRNADRKALVKALVRDDADQQPAKPANAGNGPRLQTATELFYLVVSGRPVHSGATLADVTTFELAPGTSGFIACPDGTILPVAVPA